MVTVCAALMSLLLWFAADGAAQSTDDATVVQHLRQRAIAIDSVGDFTPLVARCAAARLILLGDGSHGSHEFYALRRVLSMQLIEQQALDFIALEAECYFVESLDRYVRDLPGAAANAELAMQAFRGWRSWVWNNQQMALLLEALREHNLQRAPDARVALYGLDFLDFGHSLAELTKDPQLAAPATALRACLPAAGEFPEEYTRQIQSGGNSCAAQVKTLVQVAANGNEIFPRWLNQRAFARSQQLQAILHGEAYYRIQTRSGSGAWNIRDRHFARTLQQLLRRHGPKARGLVWAHNTHVGDGRYTEMGHWHMESLGQLLRQQMPVSQVYLLGQTSYHGSVLASRHWGGNRATLAVPAARGDSLEALLHETGIPRGLWLFDSSDQQNALNLARPLRAIGVSYDPERDASDNYILTHLAQRFDALLFTDYTTALLEVQTPENVAAKESGQSQPPRR